MKEDDERLKEIKREYYRDWREKNRDRYNAYQRQWREKNRQKVAEYNQRYWENKVNQINDKSYKEEVNHG